MSKFVKPKISIYIFAFLLIATVVIMAVFSVNMINTMCEEEAKAEIIDVINEGNGIVQNMALGYGELFNVYKDGEEKITMITANSALINSINIILRTEIQNRLNELREEIIYLPTGAFTGIPIFSSMGSNVPVTARIISNCHTEFISDFSEMGINQTRHRLRIRCKVDMELTVPSKTVEDVITHEILIAESVIVGEVPSTYLGENTTTDYLDLLPD